MSAGSSYNPVSHRMHLGRFFAALLVLPSLVLSPLPAQVILIHDHHGHDTHAHAIGVHELHELDGNPEHRHHEHEHDGPAVEHFDSEESSLVIMLDLPDGLARGRVASGSGTLVTSASGTLLTTALASVTARSDDPLDARPSIAALPLRAHGSLVGILLTSHALLL